MRPRNALQRAGDALVLEQARQGKTLEQIGDALGVTREAVRQRLAKLGHTTRDFARAACSFCGTPIVARKTITRYGLRVCRGRECVRRYRQVTAKFRYAAAHPRAALERARCANPDCGRVLERAVPREDGRPSFCAAKACQAARSRWLCRHDPVYREFTLRYSRARSRGLPPPTVDEVRRELQEQGVPA